MPWNVFVYNIHIFLMPKCSKVCHGLKSFLLDSIISVKPLKRKTNVYATGNLLIYSIYVNTIILI
jgi:hypothetical protein